MGEAKTPAPRPAAGATEQQHQQDGGDRRTGDRAPRGADEAAAPRPDSARPRPFSDWAII